jgi:hypothetical protein
MQMTQEDLHEVQSRMVPWQERISEGFIFDEFK